MNEEKLGLQANGLKWLYDMQLVEDPQLINNLKLNILVTSRYIREVEILSSQAHKSMLVYLEVGSIARFFFKKRIQAEALDRLQQLLPSFRFRVIFDRQILDLAVEKVKAATAALPKGENDEDSVDANSDASSNNSSSEA